MKILFVDDERPVTDYFTLSAKAQGFTDIEVAASGDEAVSCALHHQYDLITLDIEMPGLSGLEVLSVVRNMCPHAIIAIISGQIPPKVPGKVRELADVTIAKPIDQINFQQLLRCTAKHRENLDQIRALGEEISSQEECVD